MAHSLEAYEHILQRHARSVKPLPHLRQQRHRLIVNVGGCQPLLRHSVQQRGTGGRLVQLAEAREHGLPSFGVRQLEG